MKEELNKTQKKRLSLLIIALCAIVVIVCGFVVGYKLYEHEKKQSREIADLKGMISLLNARMDGSEAIHWSRDEFNYLAIGNSITRHGLSSYWWNSNNGMAASDAEHDYYHLVLNALEKQHGRIHGEIAGMVTWESQSHDRDEAFVILDHCLDEKIDLVTIQLGENAENLDTFEKDYESLIRHIQENCPKAEIIVVGDFWTKENRDELKAEAAEKTGVKYVSLEGVKDNHDYYAGMGTTVYDDEGKPHTIDHAGVADHPGDAGMAVIAERIIKAVDMNWNK